LGLIPCDYDFFSTLEFVAIFLIV